MLIIGYAGNILENEQNAKQGRRKTTAPVAERKRRPEKEKIVCRYGREKGDSKCGSEIRPVGNSLTTLSPLLPPDIALQRAVVRIKNKP